MRFSEAIRLGAMMKPQAFGDLRMTRTKWKSNGPLGLSIEEEASCAKGAAYEALGISPRETVVDAGTEIGFRDGTTHVCTERVTTTVVEVPDEWYALLTSRSICPECAFLHVASESMRINLVIPHLNDVHRWTRERIADWVEVQERDLDALQSLVPESERIQR